DANIEPAFAHALDEVTHAANAESFFAGAYGAIVAALIEAYRTFVAGACPSANAPELQIVRHVQADLEAQQLWAVRRLNGVPGHAGDATTSPAAWEAYLRQALCAAGGITGGDSVPGSVPLPRPH